MRFIHIGDLHLGKIFNDVNLLEDQIDILNQIIKISNDKKADCVLIAGDVYDKSNPSAIAINAFNKFVTELINNKKKVFVISGNHDSNERLSYLSDLVKELGLFVSTSFDSKTQVVTLNDKYGEINIQLLPFIRPSNVRKYYDNEKIETYQDALKIVINNSCIDTSKRNILLSHQFITGSVTCESEEFAVGGLDNIDASVFACFDYVAMGHIHRPQSVIRDSLRYSGSIYKYSFSEVNHKKSVCFFEIKEKGSFEYELIPLEFKRDVREIEGKLEDLMKLDYCEDYLKVILTDEIVDPDARLNLSMVFPNMLKFSVRNSKTSDEEISIEEESLEDKSVIELFKDFYAIQNNGIEADHKFIELIEGILNDLEVLDK